MDLVIELQFLPSIEYFCALLAHKQVFLEAHESYIKGSYRNKARIITANGIQRLSIPLKRGKHQQKNIQSVEISNNEDWRRLHWKSLKTAYENAPYWEDYEQEIKDLLDSPNQHLWDYNLNILKGLIELLSLDREINFTKEYVSNYDTKIDLRHKLLPKNNTWTLKAIQEVKYSQVFEDRLTFIPNASILDLIFCKGPEASLILERMLSK